MVLKVMFLYIPLPMFWTLFDQKGSRWTLQATTMDGDFGALVIQPDQMQTLNPILILTLVPIMDSIIYPLIRKCGLNFTSLKRMTVGMLMAAIAFVCAGLIQLQIDKTLPAFPSASQTQLKLFNMGGNAVTVQMPDNDPLNLGAFQASDGYFSFDAENISVSVGSSAVTQTLYLTKEKRHTLLIPSNISEDWVVTDDLTYKPEKGNNAIRFVNGLDIAVNVSTPEVDFGFIDPSFYSNYSLIKSGKRTFSLQRDSELCEYTRDFGFGSSYTFFIPSNLTFGPNCQEDIIAIEDIEPNSVTLALQIPQYFFITLGEVMFSVTGLEFSYSQAPSNMKAVLQAGWLLTVAVGNIIVLIVAEIAKLPQKWAEYILFASLLVAVCIIFSFMAYFYTYIDPTEIEAQFKKKADDDDYDDDNKNKLKKAEIEMVRRDSRDSNKSHDDDKGRQTQM